jgi:hypothetical protein
MPGMAGAGERTAATRRLDQSSQRVDVHLVGIDARQMAAAPMQRGDLRADASPVNAAGDLLMGRQLRSIELDQDKSEDTVVVGRAGTQMQVDADDHGQLLSL